MFSTLESTWDKSARRGRATLASFTIQVFSLGLLIAVSMLWVERPPQVRWLQISAPAAFVPVTPGPAPGRHTASTSSNPTTHQITAPLFVPRETPRINDGGSGETVADAPTIDGSVYGGPSDSLPHSLGVGFPVVIPARPLPVKPLIVSHWAEGNLIYRVQPIYPTLARQARIQGTVELRAVISKAGTIENLVLVHGHPMLSAAAIEAVRQWRYRPYLLNDEPIEVETEITVNFLLSGN
ncbi:MAG: energy transducer TonB [Terriglobales bacterium]|jgi:protein TonB